MIRNKLPLEEEKLENIFLTIKKRIRNDKITSSLYQIIKKASEKEANYLQKRPSFTMLDFQNFFRDENILKVILYKNDIPEELFLFSPSSAPGEEWLNLDFFENYYQEFLYKNKLYHLFWSSVTFNQEKVLTKILEIFNQNEQDNFALAYNFDERTRNSYKAFLGNIEKPFLFHNYIDSQRYYIVKWPNAKYKKERFVVKGCKNEPNITIKKQESVSKAQQDQIWRIYCNTFENKLVNSPHRQAYSFEEFKKVISDKSVTKVISDIENEELISVCLLTNNILLVDWVNVNYLTNNYNEHLKNGNLFFILSFITNPQIRWKVSLSQRKKAMDYMFGAVLPKDSLLFFDHSLKMNPNMPNGLKFLLGEKFNDMHLAYSEGYWITGFDTSEKHIKYPSITATPV